MHPSRAICCAKGEFLKGKRIAMAVTGSIAAVESVKIARELIRYGAYVKAYMTKEAQKFITKDALVFATGNDVVCDLSGMDEHLDDFDLVLVSPATANIIGKAASGIADNAVSTLILANLKRCVFVPAMSVRMYSNDIVRENIKKLGNYAGIIEPKMEEGEMKIPSREMIAAKVMHFLGEKLKGRRILIIGGAGYEKIDDFRIVTNLASGCTAVEMARIAYYMGADVDLLIGLHECHIPEFINAERFGTLDDLISKIDDIIAGNYDAILVPAALPDYKPVSQRGKIDFETMKGLRWEENPKFLEILRKNYRGYLVGFKAEYGVNEEELLKKAKDRMRRYKLDMVVANDLSKVKKESTEAMIITGENIVKFRGKKYDLAVTIMERIANGI